jgi:hypothetical protein
MLNPKVESPAGINVGYIEERDFNKIYERDNAPNSQEHLLVALIELPMESLSLNKINAL